MRTSIARSSLARRDHTLLLAPVVDRAVSDVAQRDVDDEHEEGERDAGRDVLLEEERDQNGEEARRDTGSLDCALPRRRAVHPLLPPAAPLGALLVLRQRPFSGRRRSGRAAAVVSRALDDSGRVAAVLTVSLALGLSHQDDFAGSRASSMVRRFRNGTSGGKSASAAAGARPTSSASPTGARSRIRPRISGSDACR